MPPLAGCCTDAFSRHVEDVSIFVNGAKAEIDRIPQLDRTMKCADFGFAYDGFVRAQLALDDMHARTRTEAGILKQGAVTFVKHIDKERIPIGDVALHLEAMAEGAALVDKDLLDKFNDIRVVLTTLTGRAKEMADEFFAKQTASGEALAADVAAKDEAASKKAAEHQAEADAAASANVRETRAGAAKAVGLGGTLGAAAGAGGAFLYCGAGALALANPIFAAALLGFVVGGLVATLVAESPAAYRNSSHTAPPVQPVAPLVADAALARAAARDAAATEAMARSRTQLNGVSDGVHTLFENLAVFETHFEALCRSCTIELGVHEKKLKRDGADPGAIVAVTKEMLKGHVQDLISALDRLAGTPT